MVERIGAYAKLLANYAEDDAVIEAGEKAELLFVRGLAFCSDSDQDGFITDAQLQRVVGAGMRDSMARARKLVEVGLWQREQGGYFVRSWTKLHETTEQKGRRLKADRERKRKAAPNGFQSESDPDSERNPDRNPPDSLLCSELTGNQLTLHNTAGQEIRPKPEPDRFDEFWQAYPRRVAKDAARKRWDVLRRRGVDQQVMINGAKAYAQEVTGKDQQFTAHAATWLNAGRWEDEPDAPPADDAWYDQ